MESRPRVAVVGGGISGLAAASFLRRRAGGLGLDVTLIEHAPRLGGKVLTHSVDGLPVDTGPDAFLVRVPAMKALVDDLGLTDQVVPAASLGAYLWSGGRLRRLPSGTLFGVPDRIGPLVRSRLLSPGGLLRAGLDLVLPRQQLPDDPSVAELLRPRLGSQLLDRLVEPLIGGVHAGTTGQLSAASTVPDIEALVRNNRSVYLAMRRRRRAATSAGGSALVSVDGGLSRLIDALAGTLETPDILLGSPVTGLERTPDGFRLSLGDGGADGSVQAQAVVLATPAFVTAELLASLVPEASDVLRTIPYVDVATVTLTYPRNAVPGRLDATGFLVPPAEGRLLVGCSWLSQKWPHLGNGPYLVFRAMVGRQGDLRWMDLDDQSLVAAVHAELVAALDLVASPVNTHVQRWLRALPQYTVGHGARLDRLDAALARVPGLHVTGAAYRGVGIAGCVAQAEKTAQTVLAQFASPTPTHAALR